MNSLEQLFPKSILVIEIVIDAIRVGRYSLGRHLPTTGYRGSTAMEDLKKIGTMVLANDGFEAKVGQVADHKTDKWGTWHIVLIDGEFKTVGYIGDANMGGIGWKIATQAEVDRANRSRNAV